MRTLYLFLLAAMILLLTSCGHKGPVLPYQEKLPNAVRSAKLIQRGADFQVQWRAPLENQDNSPLTDLDTINIERLFSFAGEFCAECTDPWPTVARINSELPAPAQRFGDLFLLNDQGAVLGQTARYRLQPHNRLNDKGEALTLKQEFRSPIEGPSGLSSIPHDKSVELQWEPAKVPSGSKLIGYQIYRRELDNPYFPLAINQRPIKKTTFSDFGLQNSNRYYYRIRSIFNFAGQTVESLPSLEVSVLPEAG